MAGKRRIKRGKCCWWKGKCCWWEGEVLLAGGAMGKSEVEVWREEGTGKRGKCY